MPNDSYENLPRVNFSVNTKEFELLRAKAQALARMGMPEAMACLLYTSFKVCL